MTIDINSWGTSQGGNNGSGGLFTENLAPNETTDNLRELQAAIRRQWNKAEWFALGDLDGPATFSFLSSTRFRVQNISLASQYHIGRRVRITGSSTGTIYGSITAVTGTPSGTDVTVLLDSGSIQNETLLVELAISSAVNSSVPAVVGHRVSFTNGPFTLVNLVKQSSGAIAIPSTTKQLIVEGYGAGGGGSRSGSGGFPDDPTSGSPGGDLTISGVGVNVVARGGAGGGGNFDGQGVGATATSLATGAIFAYTETGRGAIGGRGGIYAHDGNDGDFVQAVFNQPTFTTLSITGGSGGAGSTGSANGDGSNGLPGFGIFRFYE